MVFSNGYAYEGPVTLFLHPQIFYLVEYVTRFLIQSNSIIILASGYFVSVTKFTGMDVACGGYLQKHAKSAVSQKKLTESEIDRALLNLFTVRMRLGLFNGNPRKLPFGNIGPDQVCSTEHQTLALEAARSGIVLLKNSDRLLPLSKGETLSLAVIGPNANATDTLLGNYAGPPCKFISPLQGLQSYVNNTMYHAGCNDVACSSASIENAVDVAKQADYVVLVMGLDQTQEREKYDRLDLVLPGKQEQLITGVAKAAKKPVVLVLLCGGPVDISFAKGSSNIGSILWAGYPGEAGGAAIAETIFGDHNPGNFLIMLELLLLNAKEEIQNFNSALHIAIQGEDCQSLGIQKILLKYQ